jgi:hypothetical protein
MKKNEVFCCKACGGTTPLTYKTDAIQEDIEHTYAECQQCGEKVTVYYTDTNIRNMLDRQRRLTKRGMIRKQRELARELEIVIAELTSRVDNT